MFGPRRKRRLLLAHRALISLKSGSGIRGVILNHSGDVYVVAGAELLTANLPPQKMDGLVVVDLAEVEFVQLLNPEPPTGG